MRIILLFSLIFVAFISISCAKEPSSESTSKQNKNKKEQKPEELHKSSQNPEVKEILEKSFNAYGGTKACEKLKNCKIVYQQTAGIMKAVEELGEDTVIIEDYFSFPDKLKRTLYLASNKQEVMLFVVDGEVIWIRAKNKKVEKIPVVQKDAQMPALISTIYRIKSLLESNQAIALKQDNDENETLGLLVLSSVQNMWRSTTYFDKKTYLVVKDVKDQFLDLNNPPDSLTQHAVAVTRCEEYKHFDGVVLPTIISSTQGGKTMVKVTIKSVEFRESFPADFFNKPEDN
jgi:hypothetical protein